MEMVDMLEIYYSRNQIATRARNMYSNKKDFPMKEHLLVSYRYYETMDLLGLTVDRFKLEERILCEVL